jgi:release factor glutamine methyltransferase
VSAGTALAGQTIDAARRALTARFRTANFESAELDARTLIGAALDLALTGLIASGARALTASEAKQLDEYAQRRLAGEPVARIIGAKEFWGLPLKLSAAALVPRPDTETVVERALEILRAEGTQDRALRIADLGTGSGALLLAILSELGDAACGFGTDVSLGALDCARANAAAHGIRACFVACNYAAALGGPVDVIVSNPPYIRRNEIATLAPEVRAFEPPRALDGGEDGLDAYRIIAAQAQRILAPHGLVVVELGYGQAEAVSALFAAAGLACQELRPDLSGTSRALLARVAMSPSHSR